LASSEAAVHAPELPVPVNRWVNYPAGYCRYSPGIVYILLVGEDIIDGQHIVRTVSDIFYRNPTTTGLLPI